MATDRGQPAQSLPPALSFARFIPVSSLVPELLLSAPSCVLTRIDSFTKGTLLRDHAILPRLRDPRSKASPLFRYYSAKSHELRDVPATRCEAYFR